ncbi:MAG: glycosyltransferase, partial [Candidatus Nanopelagicales bacterium]
MSSKTLIIIPTYQESENIISILERVQAANPEANVLVVDDSSPDGTGQIVER